MNIQRAKEEILHTVKAYTSKTPEGDYRIAASRQRPILLIGPPGVGKTEIVRQAAELLDVGFVAYTMTHHTRQSAVGLPMIAKQTYQGQEYEVTRYTMSEIIGSIYAYMEQSKKTEGILFLDEINCVSETLMPTMLQLLQGKKFGEYAVPAGWIIVTAGNPYVYNTSVREFDMVTLDRVKRLDIEPDYKVWRAYAREHRLHGAILFFLDCKRDRFYYTRREGKKLTFVTARGWEDLSLVLQEYERLHIPVDDQLIAQYLQCEDIAHEFFGWYELYQSYKAHFSDLSLEEKEPDEALILKAKAAGFEERLCLLQYGSSLVTEKTKLWDEERKKYKLCRERADFLTEWVKRQETDGQTKDMKAFIEEQKKALQVRHETMSLPEDILSEEKQKLRLLDDFYGFCLAQQATSLKEYVPFKELWLEKKKQTIDERAAQATDMAERILGFLHNAWQEEAEYLQFIEALSQHEATVQFFHKYPQALFTAYMPRLILEDETKALIQEIEALKDVTVQK